MRADSYERVITGEKEDRGSKLPLIGMIFLLLLPSIIVGMNILVNF